jgi:copper chaperone
MAVQNIAFNVEGMTSDDSAGLIKDSLKVLNGVFEVIVDLNAKRVAVEYDDERLNGEIIKETIEDKGFKIR